MNQDSNLLAVRPQCYSQNRRIRPIVCCYLFNDAFSSLLFYKAPPLTATQWCLCLFSVIVCWKRWSPTGCQGLCSHLKQLLEFGQNVFFLHNLRFWTQLNLKISDKIWSKRVYLLILDEVLLFTASVWVPTLHQALRRDLVCVWFESFGQVHKMAWHMWLYISSTS